MEVQFVWGVATQSIDHQELESKIREDADHGLSLRPCHPGTITAHITATDPIEVSIQGQLLCTCGKTLANFSGASDGSKLTYHA